MRYKALLSDCEGAAAAEMALMLPLLLVLLFGTFEGGHFLWSEHKAIKGVRDGARFAARQDFSKYTCPSTIDPTVELQIKNLTRTGTVDGTGQAAIVGWDNSEVSVSLACDTSMVTGIYSSLEDSSGNKTGAPLVEVSATVPYPSLFEVIGFGSVSLDLRASAESAVMGL